MRNRFGEAPVIARRKMLHAALLLGGACFPSVAMADDVTKCDPYKDYSCLDSYLGDDVFGRIANYYRLEYGESSAPSDPNAPASRREGWPTTPQSTPPMPFTEWPYGGTQNLGTTRPSNADSPLMVGIAN